VTERAGDIAAPAASVLLLRETDRLEVLMIERHAASAFAGGALVFPGGRVDPGDADPEWAAHAVGAPADETPARIAAIREAFEEAGVLLARDRAGRPVGREATRALRPWRARIEADDRRFLELMRGAGLVGALDLLTPFAHWIGPKGLHRRFDTRFFAARLPEGQTAEADGDEATRALWTCPSAALAARAAGTAKIIFPTARILDLVAVNRTVEEAIQRARERPQPPIEPRIETIDGTPFLTIPEGLGYPITREPLDQAMRG
jgi:8-oxo-dGTP pyrophosphatase MutT (NUDIX family)